MAILADHQYTLVDFDNITKRNISCTLPESTVRQINRLAQLVGAPTYQKTPVFKKQHRRPHKHKNVICAADWEEIRNFKTTTVAKQAEGVDKDIDNVRGLLNKLTSRNYADMQANIISLLRHILDKNPAQKELEKLGAAIFEIGSVNKFWSALYARLYKDIIMTFPLMTEIYEKNFSEFMSLFDDIRYISAEEDYDRFCSVNKENAKRRSMGSFFVHLMNNGIIEIDEIMSLIFKLRDRMFELMKEDNKKNEVEEFAENLAILISNGKNTLEESERWDECIKLVEGVTLLDSKKEPSLTNKTLFKFMDLEEEL